MNAPTGMLCPRCHGSGELQTIERYNVGPDGCGPVRPGKAPCFECRATGVRRAKWDGELGN